MRSLAYLAEKFDPSTIQYSDAYNLAIGNCTYANSPISDVCKPIKDLPLNKKNQAIDYLLRKIEDCTPILSFINTDPSSIHSMMISNLQYSNCGIFKKNQIPVSIQESLMEKIDTQVEYYIYVYPYQLDAFVENAWKTQVSYYQQYVNAFGLQNIHPHRGFKRGYRTSLMWLLYFLANSYQDFTSENEVFKDYESAVKLLGWFLMDHDILTEKQYGDFTEKGPSIFIPSFEDFVKMHLSAFRENNVILEHDQVTFFVDMQKSNWTVQSEETARYISKFEKFGHIRASIMSALKNKAAEYLFSEALNEVGNLEKVIREKEFPSPKVIEYDNRFTW